jgi:signal transduction histidine kinase
VNRIMYELGVGRQAELPRFTRGFPAADRLLAAERARIARELHDVVTHSVSVMVLQAAAARKIMRRDERRSWALLESVEESGRSALEELRHFLGLLSDQDGDPPRSQPGVTEIPALIEHVREAGVDVTLCVEGQPCVLPTDVAGAVYRIVQEALTNVLKHAGGAPSRVIVRWSDGALELEIVDHGPRQGDARCDASAGRGLAGMRERAAMCGGTLEAHPCADRGYVVRARVPLDSVGARADEVSSAHAAETTFVRPLSLSPRRTPDRTAGGPRNQLEGDGKSPADDSEALSWDRVGISLNGRIEEQR